MFSTRETTPTESPEDLSWAIHDSREKQRLTRKQKQKKRIKDFFLMLIQNSFVAGIQKGKKNPITFLSNGINDPGGNRTRYLLLRRQPLYPCELRDLVFWPSVNESQKYLSGKITCPLHALQIHLRVYR